MAAASSSSRPGIGRQMLVPDEAWRATSRIRVATPSSIQITFQNCLNNRPDRDVLEIQKLEANISESSQEKIPLSALQKVELIFVKTTPRIFYYATWHVLMRSNNTVFGVITSFYEKNPRNLVRIENNSDVPFLIRFYDGGEKELIRPHSHLEVAPNKLMYIPEVTVPEDAMAPRERGGVLCTFSSKVPREPKRTSLPFVRVEKLKIEEDLFDGYKISCRTIEEVVRDEEKEGVQFVLQDQERLFLQDYPGEFQLVVTYRDGRIETCENSNHYPLFHPQTISEIAIQNRNGGTFVVITNSEH